MSKVIRKNGQTLRSHQTME